MHRQIALKRSWTGFDFQYMVDGLRIAAHITAANSASMHVWNYRGTLKE